MQFKYSQDCRKRQPSTVCMQSTACVKVVPVIFLAGTIVDTKIASGNRKRRPNYSRDFKYQLAVAACAPNVSVSRLAHDHGINTNMLFKWRRDLRSGLLTEAPAQSTALLPVLMPLSHRTRSEHNAPCTGTIEISVAGATVRVSSGTDAALLQLVLQSLRT